MAKDDKIQFVDHIGVHLWKAEKAYISRMTERIRAQGFDDLPRLGTTVFPYLKLSGTRIVDLAKKMGISKQAASQNVKELVRLGYLEMGPDPEDKRAKLVLYTEKGRDYLRAGQKVKLAMQKEMADLLGDEALEHLARQLADMAEFYAPGRKGCR